MIALVFISLLILLFPIFFPGSYITELGISFLPYGIPVIFVILVIVFIMFKRTLKPGFRFPVKRRFRGISFLGFGFFFFWYAQKFNHFYTQQSFVQESSSGTLKIFFANIHKDNTHYTEIEQIITTNDPDMIMFVEFSDHHYDHLKDFLKRNYPYTNTISWSKTFVGNMVFSKYPIDNQAGNFPQGMWRYGYFSLVYHQQNIYFYLVHTSSPDSYDHFLMRNEQLKSFLSDFSLHESYRKHDNIVVVGDFNITPRSSYYPLLSSAFSGQLTNITQRIPFFFTRKFVTLPFLKAHIDHLWTSSSLQVPSFEAITIPGSDHKGFIFTLKK